jgi:hypothetical protein
VETFLTVDLFEELTDRGASLGKVALFVAKDLLVLEGFMKDSQAALSYGLPP